MKVFKIILTTIMVFVFIVGLAIWGYPHIYGAIMDSQMRQEAEDFLDRIGTTSEDAAAATEPPATEPDLVTEPTELATKEYEVLWNEMVAYNTEIWNEKQSGLSDPWSYEQPSFKLGDYGLQNEVFGVISIPKLDLELPLFLGASNRHMADGAAILSQTSIPIGGINTNSVIAGHRGYNGAAYFRYITSLEPGDKVYVTNLWETLTYVVVDTKIINPNDVEEILIQEGKDMITLLTCHPYASGGKQRFLIFCDRVIEEQ